MARVTSFFLIYCNQFPGVQYEGYTYGEPRSGNKYYIDYLNSQPIVTARVTDRYKDNNNLIFFIYGLNYVHNK